MVSLTKRTAILSTYLILIIIAVLLAKNSEDNRRTAEEEIERLHQNIIEMKEENAYLLDEFWSVSNKMESNQQELESLRGSNKELLEELEHMKQQNKELQDRNNILKDALDEYSRIEEEKARNTMTVEATAYTAYCEGCSGTTFTGINLRSNPDQKVVAVDPSIIPLGSKVHVEGYGTAIAGDIGSAIKGNKVDLFIPNRSEALDWGRQEVQLTIIDEP